MKIHKSRVVSFFLTILLVTTLSNGQGDKGAGLPETTNNKGGIIFLKDDLELGSVAAAAKSVHSIAFQKEATSVLRNALQTHTHATGDETFRLAKNRKVVVDSQGRSHTRFEQTYDGRDVVGAALVLHAESDGKVYAINGEFAAAGSIDPTIVCNCSEAFRDVTSYPYYANITGLADSTWLTECELVVVVDSSGVGHQAWQRLMRYQPVNGPIQKDIVFVSVATCQVVAIHPQVYGLLSLETYNCHHLFFGDDDYYIDDDYENIYTDCTLISRSPDDIHTGDINVDDAHNFARATYQFYSDQYGRDSLDDHGLTLLSFAHAGRSYSNAYWDGTRMVYGDGDGVEFGAFSTAPEIVGHELTHGVTTFTSNLIYQGQSGALNEAMSDIFGAAISRQVGQSPDDVWLLGESVYTPSIPGDGGFRNMADPAQTGYTDLYVHQYRGYRDLGGVHINSGIVNLAFKLLVTGGVHPRYPNTINVPAIDADFDTSLLAAARIFYMANTACLTRHSGFFAARDCTMMHAGAFASNVDAAWTAVGVTTVGTPLTNGVPLLNQALQEGLSAVYTLDAIPAFSTVECKTLGDNGDVDLFVDLHSNTETSDSCIAKGSTSNENCTVGPIPNDGNAVITLLAYRSFTGVTVECTIISPQFQPLTDGVILPVEITLEPPIFILTDVPPGSSVSCMVVGTGFILDIYLKSASGSDSCDVRFSPYDNTACSVGPLSDPANAYVSLAVFNPVDASDTLRVGDLLCRKSVPIVLTDNVPLIDQSDKLGSLKTYVLENVAFREYTWCTISRRGGYGSIVTMMYLPKSSKYDICNPGEDPGCYVGPAGVDTKAILMVYGNADYTNIILTCGKTCVLEGMPCTVASDCCDSSLSCSFQVFQSVCAVADGPPTSAPTPPPVFHPPCANPGETCASADDCCSSRCGKKNTCLDCKAKKKKCKKPSDCCSGQCNGAGKKKKCA